MKKRTFLISFLFFLSVALFPVFAQAATYYVTKAGLDANPGTLASPWLTIQKAANTMAAGDSVIVGAGTYAETGTADGQVLTKAHGAHDNYIVFYTSAGAITKGFYILHNYIQVEGFTLINYDTNLLPIVEVYGDCARIMNNTIDGVDTTHTVAGIYLESVSDSNLVQGNTIQNIYLTMVSMGGHENLVYDNSFYRTWGDALHVWGTNNIIRGNEFNVIGVNNVHEHIDIIQVFGAGGESHDIIFEDNYAHDSDCQVCNLSDSDLPGLYNWTFRNNLFINILGQASVGLLKTKFYNNTFVNCSKYTAHMLTFNMDCSWGCADSSEVVNNLFIGCGAQPDASGTGGWYGGLVEEAGGVKGAVYDYNYVTRPVAESYGAKAGFISAYGHETHRVNGGDPLFVNIASNWNLQIGSPAIDAGLTIASFADDYAGTARPQGAGWDIGAYEYSGGVPTPPVVSSVDPASGCIAAGTSVTITGLNFGASQGAGWVKFNGFAAGSYVSWANTSIVVTTPNLILGTTTVEVQANGGLNGSLDLSWSCSPESIGSPASCYGGVIQ